MTESIEGQSYLIVRVLGTEHVLLLEPDEAQFVTGWTSDMWMRAIRGGLTGMVLYHDPLCQTAYGERIYRESAAQVAPQFRRDPLDRRNDTVEAARSRQPQRGANADLLVRSYAMLRETSRSEPVTIKMTVKIGSGNTNEIYLTLHPEET